MNGEPYMTREQIAGHFGISPSSIQRLEPLGFPRHTWAKRIVRYRISEVDAWLRENEA